MRTLLTTLALFVLATPAIADERAHVHLVPPAEAPPGQDLTLVAIVDDAWRSPALRVLYRTTGQFGWAMTELGRSSAGGYYATIPADVVRAPGVEYYVEGHVASAAHPLRVRVEPASSDRWIAAETRRLGGQRSVISLAVEAQDFGAYHRPRSARLAEATIEDRYVRGELAWTHRLVSTLYAFQLGYGFLQGTTASERSPDAVDLDRQARYGFGGVRVRLHPSAWVDVRTIMGFSHDGFIFGGGGALTLGRPWRSSVTLGAEAVQDLGPRAWLRLQWDTVPPLLLGATVSVTDVPDAGTKDGSAVAFDATYPITPRISVSANVSYAARDHFQGGFGAGLGTAFEF